ncbi:MAG: group II intron reverse transcriptase/maturase [Candidatus Brocadiaceae bacterium]|nr:group II intron reverse transcriptase/maturase [Candidatus Brocadiaceae bacterium]MCP5007931.1 group II intron reverse transcriptase/maturase [Planctomycetota bacterium]
MNRLKGGCASQTKWLNWNDIDWRKVERGVMSLQRRIVKAVKGKRFQKAKALFHLLTHSFYGKLMAILKVSTSKGSKTCGVDKVLWNTPSKRWRAIEQLKIKGYRAKPLKRKSIKKKNGKLRHLGIPTISDRAMQALFKLALEPIAETLADPNSYGFRSKRSCADATVQCHNALSTRNSAQWILEADIKACFDKISHEWILQNIPVNKRVLKQWLRSGYIDKKRWFPTEEGTPQGGVISPIIANMVLDGLERTINLHAKHTPNKNPHKINFVRYADDFVVTGNDSEYLEKEVKPLISKFLAKRGLELSPEKTKITHISQGFDFLGFNIRKYKGKCLIKPSKSSVKGIYANISECVKSHKAVTQEELIRMIAPKIRGWANFYRHAVAKQTFSLLDSKMFKLLWKWAIRRHPNKGYRWIKAKYFKTIGTRHWVFTTTDKKLKGALPLFDATKIIRHTKIRKYANPFDKNWVEYFNNRKRGRLVFPKYQSLAITNG